jgi:hypothetical protein
VENSNLQNIENNLQRLLHVETLHSDQVVPELEQYCDTDSRNWILNRDRQYRDTSPCFALLDVHWVNYMVQELMFQPQPLH